MNWKEQFDKKVGWLVEDGQGGWSVGRQELLDFISTEIIEKLISEASDRVRACPSPRNITEPPLEALKEARLIQRIDAMDAVEQLKEQWL
jgi:hypothetical protein